jgi:hypothetical protein
MSVSTPTAIARRACRSGETAEQAGLDDGHPPSDAGRDAGRDTGTDMSNSMSSSSNYYWRGAATRSRATQALCNRADSAPAQARRIDPAPTQR